MATGSRKTPEFFNEDGIDPVESATGPSPHLSGDKKTPPPGTETNTKFDSGLAAKKKAGFYLSVNILERFTRKFHELKLAGVAIDNKSTLLELALSYALDDIDKGEGSRVLQSLTVS